MGIRRDAFQPLSVASSWRRHLALLDALPIERAPAQTRPWSEDPDPFTRSAVAHYAARRAASARSGSAAREARASRAASSGFSLSLGGFSTPAFEEARMNTVPTRNYN
jgi:hypothetical protein